MPAKEDEQGQRVEEGYLGNLTPAHERTLQQLWARLFELFDVNKERSAELDRKGGAAYASKGSEVPKLNTSRSGVKDDEKKASELRAVNEFLAKYGGPYLRKALWDLCMMDDPDRTLLRFLRARKWDLDRALGMTVAAIKFRLDVDLQGILRKGELGLMHERGFMDQFRRGISYIEGNTDKGGLPIYFVHVSRHIANAQSLETLQHFVLLAMENTRLLCAPPAEKGVVVFDMHNFGLKNMDWQPLLFLVRCLEAFYPESLQRVYVHCAPWIFRGIWTMLQPLLDPVVNEKIKFSSRAEDLEEYVPRSRFRKAMGGTLDWEWQYPEPDPHENDLMEQEDVRDAIKAEYDAITSEYEKATRDWLSDDAEATEAAVYRREVLAQQLRLKYLQLMPFVRAKNVYQRTQVFRNDGLVTWRYPQTTGITLTQTIGDTCSVPALVRWLRERREDTLEDSVGGRHSPAMLVGMSYNPLDVLDLPKRLDHTRRPTTSAAAQTNRMPSGGSGMSSKPEPLARDGPSAESESNEQGASTSAGAGAAGAGAGAAGASVATSAGLAAGASPAESGTASQPAGVERQQKATVEPATPAKQERRAAPERASPAPAAQASAAPEASTLGSAPPADLYTLPADEEEGEEDAIMEEERHVRDETHGPQVAERFDLDDEERSLLSDDASTAPETVVLPTYTSGKPTASGSSQTEAELRTDLEVAHKSVVLFLNAQMKEAEELCAQGADRRLYRSAGMTLINTLKAMMTFEPNDMQVASKCAAYSAAIAKVLRKRPAGLSRLVNSRIPALSSMTLLQRHAELVYGQSVLCKALLGIVYAGDSVGVIRQTVYLHAAYQTFSQMLRMIERADSGAEAKASVDPDLRSGVYMGYGCCTLILSLFPRRLLKVMEGLGFSSDRGTALDLFARAGGWTAARSQPQVSATDEGMCRPLCDVLILAYHLVIASEVSVTDVDFDFAEKVLAWNLRRFPEGTFFLYFKAQMYARQALPEKAIKYYRSAVESQSAYKQLHHLCFFSLSLTHLVMCDYDRAYECFEVLSRESNWSKAVYQYAKAAILVEAPDRQRFQADKEMRAVPGLVQRIAGRHIPLETFAKAKANKYASQGNRLALPSLEFSYMVHCFSMTPVYVLLNNTLPRIDKFIDQLEAVPSASSYGSGAAEYFSGYCLAFFLRGVALRFVAYPEAHTHVRRPKGERLKLAEIAKDAQSSFSKVFEHASRLDAVDRYLVYFAHYEFGRLHMALGNVQQAQKEFELVLSRKPLVQQSRSVLHNRTLKSGKADYLLSSMCQLRCHVALDTLKMQQVLGVPEAQKTHRASKRLNPHGTQRSDA